MSGEWKGSGRRPVWPAAWLALASAEGGSRQLREVVLGYKSKTTLSDKIHGRSPWSQADKTLLAFLAAKHKLKLDELITKPKLSWPGLK